MTTFKWEQELRQEGQARLQPVPELIRTRQDGVYASLADLPAPGAGPRRRQTRKAIARTAGAAAAAAIIGLMGSAYVSPVMAKSLKEWPVAGSIFKMAGDLGLQTADVRGLVADPGVKVTHDGITLGIPQVMYDGIRLSLAVQREGRELPGGLSEFKHTGEGEDAKLVYPVGSIKDFEMFINGTPLREMEPEQRPSMVGKSSSDPNSMLFELTSFSNQNAEAWMPDRFNLTAKFTMEGVAEPFVLELPVEKNAARLILPATEERTADGVKLTLEQLKFTPVSTAVMVRIEQAGSSGKLDPGNLMQELWDDQGRPVQFVSGLGLYEADGSNPTELIFDRLEDVPKELILKTFVPEFKDKDKGSGLFALDSQGNVIKHEIEALRITVPVDYDGLKKLYEGDSLKTP
ncbi:DUF4179 domain-containing protein [Paenibacillus sp. FSL K6-1096]|uniref:DUF4179 domain-containing protein n=1 Tax=Paenibacillus sp. FSL K6-1096 TaxID=2921460 RepID=UPI0030EC0FFB